jgi:hypothetical protein
MSSMRARLWLLAVLVGSQPAMAQPFFDDPIYAQVSAGPSGQAVPSVEVFYDQLAGYGFWYDDPVYGFVFAPEDHAYVPFSNGNWQLTAYGWTWISHDPFGWATDHYGRWVWRDRWVWVPDTTWGPAWVQWRAGESWVGWAPLGFDDDAYVPDDYWRFIPVQQIAAPDLTSYYVRDHGRYLRDSEPLWRFGRYGQRWWIAGPGDEFLRHHDVDVRRVTVAPRQIGRFDATQLQRAQVRLRDDRANARWTERVAREQQVRSELDARARRSQVTQRERAQQQQRLDQQQAQLQQREARATSAADRQRIEAERQRVEQQRQQMTQQRTRQQTEARQRVEEQRRSGEQRRLQDEQRRAEEAQRAGRQPQPQTQPRTQQQQRVEEQQRVEQERRQEQQRQTTEQSRQERQQVQQRQQAEQQRAQQAQQQRAEQQQRAQDRQRQQPRQQR